MWLHLPEIWMDSDFTRSCSVKTSYSVFISQQIPQDLGLEGAVIPASPPTPLNTQAQSVHQSPQNRQGKISTVPFKTVSNLKSQQENEQLTRLLHDFEELLISLIGTSYAFISSSEPHQTPARLNDFSWKMRNCKSSRLPQQQSGFSSENAINEHAKNFPAPRHWRFNSILQSWAHERYWRWGWDLCNGSIPK